MPRATEASSDAWWTTTTTVLIALFVAGVAAPAMGQTDALVVEAGKVGIGTSTPSELLHVTAANGTAKLLVKETGGGTFEELMELFNEDGGVGFRLRNSDGLTDFNKIGHEFRVNFNTAPAEMVLSADGNLLIRGNLTTQNPPGTFPDYVFDPDYELMSLDELRSFVAAERHLPGVMTSTEIEEAGGVDMTILQLQLLRKVEELSLYILNQHETIKRHEEQIRALKVDEQ